MPYRRDVEELTATIEALRDELSHLDHAMRLRALVEQAKGVLMAKNSISAQAAFDRLREISQAENARLVDVAAILVGVTLPDGDGLDLDEDTLPDRLRPSAATSPQWRALRADPQVRRGTAGAVLDVLAAGAADGQEAAELALNFLSPLGVSAVTLWRTRADASLEQVGQMGYALDTASAWRRVPLTIDVPVTRAARSGKAVFGESPERLVDEFPLLDGVIRSHEALVSVPVVGQGTATGVVGMSWSGARSFSDADRERIVDLATRIGRVVLRDLLLGDPDWGYLATMLGVVTDPWLVLRAVDDGVAGLVIEGSADNLDIEESIGARLLVAYPSIAADRVLVDEIARLMHDGGKLTWQSDADGSAPWAVEACDVRAVRVGTRIVTAWHHRD